MRGAFSWPTEGYLRGAQKPRGVSEAVWRARERGRQRRRPLGGGQRHSITTCDGRRERESDRADGARTPPGATVQTLG